MSDTFTKQAQFMDNNAFSGSTEKLRTAMGLYWTVISESAGESAWFQSASAMGEGGTRGVQGQSIYLDNVQLNIDTKVTASSEIIVPNYKIAGRIKGDATYIESDSLWKTFLLGGNYGTETFKGAFNNGQYDTYGFSYELPYSYIEHRQLNEIFPPAATSPLKITYNYNLYLPRYEAHIANLANEKLIPNAYFLRATNVSNMNGETWINTSLMKFMSLEDTVPQSDLDDIYSPIQTSLLPPYKITSDDVQFQGQNMSDQFFDKNYNLRTYLNDLDRTALSSSTVASVSSTTQNIFFDAAACNELFATTSTIKGDIENLFPFYVHTNFAIPPAEPPTFRNLIKEFNYSSKFLKILKEYFLEQDGALSNQNMTTYLQFKKIDEEKRAVSETSTTSNITLKSANLIDMLTYSYNNLSSSKDDSYFIGNIEDPYLNAAADPNNTSRFLNTQSTLMVLNSIIEEMKNIDPVIDANGLTDLLEAAGRAATYTETMAYRIEKRTAASTGDNVTDSVVQNFWFFNGLLADEFFDYLDTQVKYNTGYTYRVYAYVLSSGIKYRVDDLRLSRQIGYVDDNANNTYDSGTDRVCLEFYNPQTNEVVPQLYVTEENNPLSSVNQFASLAQTTSTDPYLADFNLYYEPTLKIFEIPLGTKSLMITDHPPSEIDVVPFQKIDNSQTLGFLINYEEYPTRDTGATMALPYPTVVTRDDNTLKVAYSISNDLTTAGKMFEESVSKAATIEVFRMGEKPTAYTDFANHLYTQIDLSIKNTQNYLSNHIFYDKITTNQKYYYLFRFANEHNIAGYLSPIIEAEMIDDGGYKYSVFNDLFEEDLTDDTFINPSKQFKKIIQILPNMQHIQFDTTDVDFNLTAAENLSNLNIGTPGIEESIWERTFKVRLTSRKTGKKIDLNLTFNVNEDG